jgi:hypothetical protein
LGGRRRSRRGPPPRRRGATACRFADLPVRTPAILDRAWETGAERHPTQRPAPKARRRRRLVLHAVMAPSARAETVQGGGGHAAHLARDPRWFDRRRAAPSAPRGGKGRRRSGRVWRAVPRPRGRRVRRRSLTARRLGRSGRGPPWEGRPPRSHRSRRCGGRDTSETPAPGAPWGWPSRVRIHDVTELREPRFSRAGTRPGNGIATARGDHERCARRPR